jgi:hypothetical protein
MAGRAIAIWNGVAGTSITLDRAAGLSISANHVADTPIASHVVSMSIMSIIQDRSIVPARAAGTPTISHPAAWLSMVLNGG